MTKWLEMLNAMVWCGPTLILILLTGLLITIRTRGVQIRYLPRAISKFLKQRKSNDSDDRGVSSQRALCTALAATVGTGNLAGVAGAIALGGPGVLFWMWVCAFGGMALKFAEATLSVYFHAESRNGEKLGGPMYMIIYGMGERWKFLAALYSFFGIVAALGVGNATQVNTMIGSINQIAENLNMTGTNLNNLLFGAGFAVLIGTVFLGGAKCVGRAAERIVPFGAAVYILLCAGALLFNVNSIPTAFSAIIKGAFKPKAITGGAIASAFVVLRIGVSRGVFTNEAGMGTAGIAHGAANVSHPVEQGLMGIVEVFLDTIVICTLTGLVILCSGVDIQYGVDRGILLTLDAFESVYGGWVKWVIAVAVCCFAFATILGWGLYGGRCAQFLFGERAWKAFVFVQMITVVVGAVLNTGTIWLCSEIVNGLMALPCLVCLVYLIPMLVKILKEYKHND